MHIDIKPADLFIFYILMSLKILLNLMLKLHMMPYVSYGYINTPEPFLSNTCAS